MPTDRDPVEAAADESYDLYDVASWEPRSRLDRLSTAIYYWLIHAARLTVILLALLILITQFVLSGFATMVNPIIGVFVAFSIIPAFLIAFYVWRTDITMREPLSMLVATFLLGVLFAGFAGILNSIARPLFSVVPFVGLALFFFLIVGPVEELVKWLAVRLYAYRTPQFDAVLDGAVYGAAAGLGFATIENTLYIGSEYVTALQTGGLSVSFVETVLPVTAARTLAGPGHVLYSAFAGYYLGLAKFNRRYAGPIVVKGLLVAAFVHALYNTLVSYLPFSVLPDLLNLPPVLVFLLIVVIYDGVFGYVIYRKIARYRRYYRDIRPTEHSGQSVPQSRSQDAPSADASSPATEGDDPDRDR